MPSNHLILCRPLLLLPSIFPSTRVFSNESALHIRWPKYWSFSFNISPSNGHPGLISFRMDWLDLLAVQGHVRGEAVGCMINLWAIFWLVADEVEECCFRKLNYQSSNCNQSRVYAFEVSSFHLLGLLLFSHKLMSVLCDPMNCSMLGFHFHCLPEFVQTHVHWVGGGSSFYKNNLRMYVRHCYLFLSRSQSYSLTYCLKYSLLFVQLPLCSYFCSFLNE